MSNKLTIEELLQQIQPLQGYVGQKMQHARSSDWYRITGIHFRESDMSIEFTYQTLHREPVAFSRPIAELFDGRFVIK